MSVQALHGGVIRRRGAEPDEAVRPHEDGASVRNAGLGRDEARAGAVDNQRELFPARPEFLQPRDLPEYDEMVGRPF
jgi:hypothetical protein